MTPPSPEEPEEISPLALKKLYEQRGNLMSHLRGGATEQNSPDAILLSYDLQSGSYFSKASGDAHYRQCLDRYTQAIADVIGPLGAGSLLEAGVGEAGTLCNVVAKLPQPPQHLWGIDLAWSRIVYARRYAALFPQLPIQFSTGSLFQLPFPDNSFDVILTSHAIEPNGGAERAALAELSRVTRRWLVLCEPSYELGNAETRRHIEEHSYCRNLPEVARALGLEVVEHRMLDPDWVPYNQTGLVVIRKPGADSAPHVPQLACPRSRTPLVKLRGHHFCPSCLVVYPEIDNVPCLLSSNGIIATKYAEPTAATQDSAGA